MVDQVVLRAEGITKSFPGVVALRSVDFELRRGEVHALLGENGAGKSTLVNILSGVLKADEGVVEVDGAPVRLLSPSEARRLGIATVYQELSLALPFTVAENIVLGQEPTANGLISWRQAVDAARDALSRIGAQTIDPRAPVEELPIAERQMVEIAKALYQQAKILILDEPTSSLSFEETRRVFRLIQELRQRGLGIIYISHRLEEIKQIADRVTVFRDGQNVGSGSAEKLSTDEIVSMMIGRRFEQQFPWRERRLGKPLLRLDRIRREGAFTDVTLVVREGEVVGLAGLAGDGREELIRSVFGLGALDGGGVYLGDSRLLRRSPRERVNSGVCFIPGDRTEGIASQLSVGDNIVLAALDRLTVAGLIAPSRERSLASSLVRSLNIVVSSLAMPAGTLSGGNKQKVVLARWMATKSRVYLFDDATRGLDVSAKHEVYELMMRLAGDGCAVLFVSSDIDEVIGMSDTICVMREGRVVTNSPRGTITKEAVLRVALGGTE